MVDPKFFIDRQSDFYRKLFAGCAPWLVSHFGEKALAIATRQVEICLADHNGAGLELWSEVLRQVRDLTETREKRKEHPVGARGA